MEAFFLKLVNMSITASWLVLAIIAVRLIFKKAPKWILCLLWGLVAFRLICPFSIESAMSLIPSAEPLPQEIIYTADPQIHSGVPVIDHAVNPMLESSMTPAELTSANPTQIWSFIFSQLWILGVVIMGLYALISYLIVRRRVRPSIRVTGNLYLCDSIETPFILGIGKPRIYLPSSLDQTTADHVLAHELECLLLQVGRLDIAVGCGLLRDLRLCLGRGSDGPHFGEGIHINDPACPVQRLHGRLWVGIKAEFGIIVILDDPFSPVGPVQQLHTASHRGHQTRGKMVGRRTVKHIRRFQAVRNHTLVIHGGADTDHAAGGVDLPDFAVTRLLHCIDFVPAQQLDQQIIQKVRSGADEDIFRIHMHTPEGCQMVRNGLPKFRDALIGQRCKKLFSVVQHDLPLEPGPDGEGEMLRTGAGQIQHRFFFRRFFRSRHWLPAEGAFHRLHEVAHLFPGTDIAFRQKLVVGRFHGDFADFQMGRKSPLGGQLLARQQYPRQDITADAAVQRLIQRHTR